MGTLKTWARGAWYLILTNLAVLIVLGIVVTVLQLFGVDVYGMLGRSGYDWGSMFIVAALFGFGGSLISLLISKPMAKMATRAKIIDQPSNRTEQWLVSTVERLARDAGIGMPDVAIFPSPEPNAFATGASRNRALVAVSVGLLNGMREDEVEAVIGHEISHVANGDMITMTLIQGVLNTFVFFLARVIGTFVDRAIFRSEEGHGVGYFVTVIVAQIALGIGATMIAMWFSRHREFRADAGSAGLLGARPMVNALRRLQAAHGPSHLPDQMQAFGIRGGEPKGWQRLFLSHPPLEERIAALEAGAR